MNVRRLCGLLLVIVSCAVAQQKATEEQVKAAYLYNFGKFATWPADANVGEFRLCVMGENPFGRELENAVKGENIGGAPVRVVYIRDVREVSGCRVAFVSASERGRAREVVATLAKEHVLAVSDMPDFLDRGGMIALVRDGSRVRFEVNVKAADAAGIGLSSELLRVAKQVVR